MRIECKLLPGMEGIATRGNYLVFGGLSRRAAFALEADAKLFMAADDLRDALVDCIDGYWHLIEDILIDDPECLEIAKETLAKSQAAIRKAKGIND